MSLSVIYAHEVPAEISPHSIFLAGPSPRGDGVFNWRPEAIELLASAGFTGQVFSPLPRDGEWSKDYYGQIAWELEYLERAAVIMFWIPRDLEHLPGFTTNVEFGLYVKSGKIVLGFPKGAPKTRYLEYVANTANVSASNSLGETVAKALRLLRTRA
jgi:hypothetical protein